jgi:LPS O-antigen subunit length determinant protein (WzzB/FepE family)
MQSEKEERMNDFTELSRAIKELHELKASLATDPNFLETQSAPYTDQSSVVQENYEEANGKVQRQIKLMEQRAKEELYDFLKEYIQIEENSVCCTNLF